jgi:glycosyltransferase involved in cell wall biosynthesis
VSLVRAAAESRLSGLPVVFRGDSQPLPDSAGLARRMRTQAFLRLYTSYLYVGKRNREFLAQNGISAERTFFSPHCVDNEMFTGIASAMDRAGSRRDAREELGIAPEAFVVLFAGKLEAIKRPWDVVRGAGALDGSVVVILAGSGNAESECRSAARETGANVKFVGFQNQAELGRLYGLSDCLVLPSQDETWGLVVNEAMAAGLPCIVSDRVGCGPDLIESGRTGYVVPVGDIAALCRALDEIRAAIASSHDFRPACREKIAGYSFGAATAGLAAALDAELARR